MIIENNIDVHALTNTQLASMKRELIEELRHIQEAVHTLGPSSARDRALLERRELLDHIDRELAHRRVDHLSPDASGDDPGT